MIGGNDALPRSSMTPGHYVHESVLSDHLLMVEGLMAQDSQARLDSSLRRQLPEDAFESLSAWCNDMDISIDFRDWLDGGHSRASVALVGLRGVDPYRDAVLKYCPARGDEPQRDFKAFRRAAKSGPRGFAQKHLVGLDSVSETPIRNGAKGIFLIMEYPPGTYYRYVSMATLLDRTSLAAACKEILPQILQKWNDVPRSLRQEHGRISAQEFLQEILGARCDNGKPIRLTAEAIEREFPDVYLTEAGTELPRPLAAVLAGEGIENISLPGIRGNGHGDLHLDNIFIPTPNKDAAPSATDFKEFVLIDLSTFGDNRLLAVDPAHLLLSIVARWPSNITGQDGEKLADFVLAPDKAETGTIPTGLVLAIQAIHGAGVQLANKRRQYPGWRMECLAAAAACALLFVGRDGIDKADRRWFLRLAARAISMLQQEAPGPEVGGAAARIPSPSRAHGVRAKVIPISRAPAEQGDSPVPPANAVSVGSDDRIGTCVQLAEELVSEIRDLVVKDMSSVQGTATATTYARVIAEDLANALDGAQKWYDVQRPDMHLAYATAIGIAEVQLTRLQQTLEDARCQALDRAALDGLSNSAEALASCIGDISQMRRPGKSPYP
jgi:hypothetical protein